MGSSSNTNHREERVRARTKKKNNININVNRNKRKTSKEEDEEEPQRVEFVLKSHSNTNRKVCFHFSFFLSRRFFPFSFGLCVAFPRLIVREG